MTEVLKASVQYGDWRGTAAADNADNRSIQKFLRDRGELGDGAYVVGIRLFIGENRGGKVERPWLRAVVADGSGYDDVKAQVSAAGTLRFKEIDIELSLEEFFGLFKRFSIVLTSRDMGLEGREYEIVEP
ncbi:hypothetical protein [Mesorhizobium sp.]|uniref:hypothetical protein n=1 Tax=Mesorhizobium sp. TaxID=1871066 RepID=UPI001204B96C|nr:hypothetical protein [Mesorhizobium sp.]TIN10366.1 MAG: hypothetical protein E5Y14_10895 [Mesorhizobium sp.]